MNIIEKLSPNCDGRDGQSIDMLVMHYTGMKTMQEALDRLCDPAAKVSAHYMVDEDGTVYRIVPEDKRAWHAGVSSWRGNDNINQRSIGIEIVNAGHEFGYHPFPKIQMEAVAQLSQEIIARHNIPSWNVVAHSDVAPSRKEDPGELFDWKMLAQRGIGAMPSEQDKSLLTALIGTPMKWVARLFAGGEESVTGWQGKLAAYGYPVQVTGIIDQQTKTAVTAFQRHFRPSRVDGIWDEECSLQLQDLLKRVPAVTIILPDQTAG